MHTSYYVYAYITPEGIPYYIGKGMAEYWKKIKEDWYNSAEFKADMEHWEYMEQIRKEQKEINEKEYATEEYRQWYVKYCNGEITLDETNLY